jgi:hypothetical protein
MLHGWKVMPPVDVVETESERLAREAEEKQDADTGTARSQAASQSRPISEQSFMQYMQLVEERRQRDQEVQNKLVHHILSQGGQGRDNGGRGVSLSDFQNTCPLPFSSAPEPMDAENWLRDTERKLNTVGCSDDEKLRYATYLLSGPATAWWENLLAIQPPRIGITWTQFKQKFRETHVPDSIMELKRREFENLKQNDSPVMRYVREFSVLSCYATDEVDTEEKRKKIFMKGIISLYENTT